MGSGVDPGGKGVPFGGPQNSIKREKSSRTCTQTQHILVVNSYTDPPPPPPPLSEILHPPLGFVKMWKFIGMDQSVL